MFDALVNAFRAPDIRKRILFILGMLIIVRMLAHVPVPGIDREALAGVIGENEFLQLINLFSGGGLQNFSIIALGVNPYINASIIMQLMTGVVPRLQQLSREGEYGRGKINSYTRYLTVALAILQSYGYLALLSSPQNGVVQGFDITSFTTLTQIVSLTAGTVLLMWIGELITERGIGNGISFIIFAGIVAGLPGAVSTFMTSPDWTAGLAFTALAIVAVTVIVYVQEGQRRIPIQYASRVRGRRMYQGGATFLPLRVNQAGVIPIIFAVSILLFPVQMATYFSTSGGVVESIANTVIVWLSQGSPLYAITFFLLVVGFTYFYTAFTFKPDETADQLRKNGGFIPGIRPGAPTRDYLAKVVFRISLAGALFLGTVAVSPIIFGMLFAGSVVGSFALGGTALLIVVSVVVETMKQLEAQLMMRNYEGFIK
ncbi:MAG: preprotein translocase subunit SecY [Chloroflexota bacterium]|nr:preprotein translocase subunit SecY [Chloroflexota bacterium]